MANAMIVRSTDRQVVEAFADIASELKLDDCRIRVNGVDSFFDYNFPTSSWRDDARFQEIAELESTVLTSITLTRGEQQPHQLLSVSRDSKSVLDTLDVNVKTAQQAGVTGAQFARLLALAKQKLKEVAVSSEFSSTGFDRFDTVIRARFGELEELRSIGGKISIDAHNRMLELDRAYQERCKQLEEQLAERRKQLEGEIDAVKETLRERASALTKRESEFDLSDSKAARRKLRQNLLETLGKHSQRFELSRATRQQRWPVAALLAMMMLVSGYLTYVAFFDFYGVLQRQDADWKHILAASLKQVFFAVTFLGFAAYSLRWLESWSRRHADAEFHFKQLELDIDRASWVVEVALEWRQQEGAELPQELLSQLSNRLFSEREVDSHPPAAETVAGLLLGSVTNMKLKTPGMDMEFGGKDLKKKVPKAKKPSVVSHK